MSTRDGGHWANGTVNSSEMDDNCCIVGNKWRDRLLNNNNII